MKLDDTPPPLDYMGPARDATAEEKDAMLAEVRLSTRDQ